jgi:dipeptidyl aminopeptidase/acylaminoacyl peptidase
VARDQIVFATDGALVTQRLDLDNQRLTGRVGVLGVRVGQSPSGALLATAADDAVIFSEPVTTAQQLVWFDRSGEPTGTVGSPGDFWNVRLAPDGRRSLATLLDPLLRTLDIVLFDGRSLMPTRVSLSIDADDSPAWSPDGLRVAWTQAGRSVMVRGAGAVLPADTVARFDEPVRVTDWMPDGSALVVARAMPGTREDLWIVPVGGGAPQPLVTTPFADVQGAVSPDGRWIAYASDESGRFEVYVDRILDRSPGPGARERVSSGGGSDPRWTRNGQELFFRRGSAIHVATPASGRGQNAAATTSMVFDTRAAVRSFDVTGDGQRFLLSLPAETPPPPARLILNWPDPGR